VREIGSERKAAEIRKQQQGKWRIPVLDGIDIKDQRFVNGPEVTCHDVDRLIDF